MAAPRTLTFGRLSRGPAGGAATPPAPFIDADDDAGQARPLPDVRADDDSAFADVTLPEMPAGIDGRELVQRMLRESLAFFASEVIRGDVTGSGTGGTFIAADFHIEWDDVLRKHKKICILAPRDHGKSQTLTIALPIWEAWRRPGIEVAIFSEIQPQAEAQLAKLKQQIENNPRLQHLVDPAMWSAQKIRLTNGSTIIAKGFGVKTRGMHPHLIICDDVVSEASMYSSLVRERQANYFYGAIRNMLVPGGQIVVVGTPQHEEDLYGLLERNNEWFFKRYQAIDKAGKILFPERYDEKLLAERRREIGEIRFTREFLCLPISGGSSLFPEELVSGEPFFALNARVGSMVGERPAREWWVERGIRAFYIGVDIATSTSTRADYFVIFVIGIDAFGNRWVVDIFREQGLEYKAQKAKIHEYAKLWRAEMVCVESNQAQKIWGQELIQDTDLPIYMHQTGSEKHGLEKGIPSLRVLFENGKYRCPRGDDETITITNIWLAELQSWTFTKEKGVISIARHDDVAMAQWLCELAIGKGDSFSFSFGETEGDAQVAAEEEALAREFDAKIVAGLDPWETMGIEAEDLVPRPGRPRANLDFAPPGSQPPGMTSGARPAHPLGPGIPLLGGNGWGRS